MFVHYQVRPADLRFTPPKKQESFYFYHAVQPQERQLPVLDFLPPNKHAKCVLGFFPSQRVTGAYLPQ